MTAAKSRINELDKELQDLDRHSTLFVQAERETDLDIARASMAASHARLRARLYAEHFGERFGEFSGRLHALNHKQCTAAKTMVERKLFFKQQQEALKKIGESFELEKNLLQRRIAMFEDLEVKITEELSPENLG